MNMYARITRAISAEISAPGTNLLGSVGFAIAALICARIRTHYTSADAAFLALAVLGSVFSLASISFSLRLFTRLYRQAR